MRKPRLLDLFCKAGGAGMGYLRAGFDVVGVDIEPQPNYPFEFHQADALAFPLDGFDAYHASPPCQHFSIAAKGAGTAHLYPDLIPTVRERLKVTGHPYIIENVPGAPLEHPIRLCGLMFGLKVFRHRLFESNVFLMEPEHVSHAGLRLMESGGDMHYLAGKAQYKGWRGALPAMEVPWMTWKEGCQAIPPAYTEFIGRQLMAYVTAREAITA